MTLAALVVSPEDLAVIRAALGALAADYRAEIEESGDDAGEVDAHTFTLDAVEAVAAREPVTLGGLDGVILSFGDGCDSDTWRGAFGHLEAGYGVRVTRDDGTTFRGFVTDVDDGEAGLVVEEVDLDDGEPWPDTAADNYAGTLAACDVARVAGIHIY